MNMAIFDTETDIAVATRPFKSSKSFQTGSLLDRHNDQSCLQNNFICTQWQNKYGSKIQT